MWQRLTGRMTRVGRLAAVQTNELLKKRDAASGGVITLDDSDFSRYAERSDRQYSLIIFMRAKGKESPHMKMDDMFANFKLASEHVKKASTSQDPATVAASKNVFFAVLEFSHSQRAFARLQVKVIPWIMHISPKVMSGCAFLWLF